MARYSPDFYARREARVISSASALVPAIVALLEPRSVIDVGCANGIWLRAFAENGVNDLCGLDGPWVPREKLKIPSESFYECDFEYISVPFNLDLKHGKFDLLISLELLEHISEKRAEYVIDFMCSMSDSLLVSAAVPNQGGTRHVNEQWPRYWQEKLQKRGFFPCDFIRAAYWNDERIAPFYRQNLIGYFRGRIPSKVYEFARSHLVWQIEHPPPLCHPDVFSVKLGALRASIDVPPPQQPLPDEG